MQQISPQLINNRAGHSQDYEDFPITYSPIKAGVYNIYLYGDIISAQQFIGAVEVMAAAGENDTVIIHLSTNGGSLEATDTLIQAMRECEAHIVCKASGGVHSAGSIILLEADMFSLSENASFLIHNGSVGTGGKFSDYRAEVAHTGKYMEKVLRSTYNGFLTEMELDDMLKGVDLWLDSQEFSERYEKRNKYFQAKNKAMEQELAEYSSFNQDKKKSRKPKTLKAPVA